MAVSSFAMLNFSARSTFLVVLVWIQLVIQAASHAPSPPPPPPPPLPFRPYPWISGAPGQGLPGSEYSPDPLVNWQWDAQTNVSQLQLYNVSAVGWQSTHDESFLNLNSLLAASTGGSARVMGDGMVTFDFGTESAGWLEIDSPDLTDELLATVQLGISETNQPFLFGVAGQKLNKLVRPVRYGCCTYRLETPENWEIYEGVRFGFLNISGLSTGSFTITALRVVAQTLPVPYTGSFNCSDTLLTRSWYTGVYCPKLNMAGPPLPGAVAPSLLSLDAILINRGDRIGWTGDDHVSQKAIMKALGQHDFVRQNLWNTHNDSNSIESYAVYWTMSVVDYFMETNDVKTLELYVLNIDAKLQYALSIEGSSTGWGQRGSWTPANLRFFGWDERLGAGFENASCMESQRDFSMVTARACNEFAAALEHASLRPDFVTKYRTAASQILTNTRQDSRWTAQFGMHAAADAINTDMLTTEELQTLATRFDDKTQICSLSSFNMYWILQALGRLNNTAKAEEAIRLCWGGQVELGATTYWEVYNWDWNEAIAPHEPIFSDVNGWTSLCHPWSSGLVQWMTENMAGIAPLSPGYKRFRVRPSRLDVTATVPLPEGRRIQVDFKQNVLRMEVPVGTQAQLAIPRERTARNAVASFPVKSSTESTVYLGHACMHLAQPFWCFEAEFSQGVYSVELPASVLPILETDPFSAPSWEVKLDNIDHQTQGNWKNVYGSKGWVLFSENKINGSFPGPTCDLTGSWITESSDAVEVAQSGSTFSATLNGQPWMNGTISTTNSIKFDDHTGGIFNADATGYGCDSIIWLDTPSLHWCRSGKSCQSQGNGMQAQLPTYVDLVSTPGSPGYSFPGVSNDDDRALLSPDGNGRLLSNGLVSHLSSNAAVSNAYVDIFLRDNTPENYTVSFYLCDFNAPGTSTPSNNLGQARSMGLLLYDRYTYKQLAPIAVVNGFENGVWYTYQFNRSLRLRVLQRLGDGPTLSAIMFD